MGTLRCLFPAFERNILKFTIFTSQTISQAMPCRDTQDNGSWWQVPTKHGPLEKGMANHFSILALRTP